MKPECRFVLERDNFLSLMRAASQMKMQHHVESRLRFGTRLYYYWPDLAHRHLQDTMLDWKV